MTTVLPAPERDDAPPPRQGLLRHPEFRLLWISKTTSKFVNNINLAHRAKLVNFDGDVQFFLATDGRNSDSPDPAAWRPHVTGQIDVHLVPCRHGAMTQPEPLAQICPVPRRTAA